MSSGQLARRNSSTSNPRSLNRSVTPGNVHGPRSSLQGEPCAATASIFLFTQGPSILCLHHDTLAIERQFKKHKEQVILLSVDNVSERGAGRLVASYDAGQTAIVWDLFTGDEIARFASYEQIRVASWMKNGNVAFGNVQGNVILFEPSTSEHVSARTIFDPITAIAPAADCQTYAIGYMNGSILIATLQPAFTILHTLSTSRAPSPIANLEWHASSTKQKSDMLAVQTLDGDLRVWSIAKPATADIPKTIRVLKRGDNVEPGLTWVSWSKNGRILQYSEGETWSWDVRTKHVSCEPIPTSDGVKALANYGPTATLFTLGPNSTVQQYDLNPPALVKTVQYEPGQATNISNSSQSTPKLIASELPGAAPPMVISNGYEATPRGPQSLSTIQRAANEMQAMETARKMRAGALSPVSTRSRADSVTSRSSNGPPYDRTDVSVSSRAASGTTFSALSPLMATRESLFSGPSSYLQATPSVASSGQRSKPSRLRNEVMQRPGRAEVIDLFPVTRARLTSIPYSQPPVLDQTALPPDDLRVQMLRLVFGWEGDIESMIREEIAHHPVGSMNVMLLSKWLGEVDVDMMATAIGSGSIDSSEWMVLALSQMGGAGSNSKLGHAFVERLLHSGDIHTAATILVGMSEREDAVEIYVSRNFFMEAIILTCILFPKDWLRQAHLVRRWGEFVVENSQQHLAIRCFSATGSDPSKAWPSPSQSSSFQQSSPSSISQVLSPPTSPPLVTKPNGMTRMTTKNSSLKVITSFAKPQESKFNFPGLRTEDQTPTNAPGVTPIAESAISPGGTPSTYLRQGSRPFDRVNRAAMSESGYSRHRLPSIGETPTDVTPPVGWSRSSALPTPNDSGSEFGRSIRSGSQASNLSTGERQVKSKEKSSVRVNPSLQIPDDAPLLLSSARYDPMTPVAQDTPQTAVPKTALHASIPADERLTAIKDQSRRRNGSRDRKPDGLHIQMPSLTQINLNAYAASGGDSSRSDHRRSNTWSGLDTSESEYTKFTGRSDTKSPLTSGQSFASGPTDHESDRRSPPVTGQSFASSAKSPSISGRSIDQYISSLDEAFRHSRKPKPERRDKSSDGRSDTASKKSRSRQRHRDISEDRGRGGERYIRPAKRSPSSPVPMSPEDLLKIQDEQRKEQVAKDSSPDELRATTPSHSSRAKGASKTRSSSKTSEWSQRTVRRQSPSRTQDGQYDEWYKPKSRSRSRRPHNSRGTSPSGRGRSKSKPAGSGLRSPSSPLPMSPHPLRSGESDDDDDPLRLVEANRQRLRSRHRSGSRRPRETLETQDRGKTPNGYNHNEGSGESSQQQDLSADQKTSDDASHAHRKSARTLKKEQAARELEARRESLVRRPLAPPVPLPQDLSSSRPSNRRSQTDQTNSPTSWTGETSPKNMQSIISQYNPQDREARAASVGPVFGLPATPRAMRHPKFESREEEHAIPAVPAIPQNLEPLAEQYYTGQPVRELPRSMSAPVPESPIMPPMPTNMPTHPAFHKALRPSNKKPNFAPLGEIGSTRRRPSMDGYNMSNNPASTFVRVDEKTRDEPAILVIPNSDPPILPELQHLSSPTVPPPPPPPPAFPNANHASLSSGSGVGVINIVMDNPSRNATPVIDVVSPATDKMDPASSPQRITQQQQQQIPPPPPAPPVNRTTSPAMQGQGHRRGRSINENISTRFKGISDRMRSTSRGRNNAKSPPIGHPQTVNGQSPYESIPPPVNWI